MLMFLASIIEVVKCIHNIKYRRIPCEFALFSARKKDLQFSGFRVINSTPKKEREVRLC